MSKSNMLLRVFYTFAALCIVAGIVLFASYFVRAMDMLAGPNSQSTPTVEDVVDADAATAPASQPAAALQPLPMAIRVRPRSLSDGGYAAQFRNASDKPMRVDFEMEATTSHPRRRETFEIPPNGTVEIGWDNGWKLMPGDRMTLTSPDYLPGAWQMP